MLVVQVNWLGRDGGRAAHIHGQTRPYWHGGRRNSKLELGRARFKAGWGRAVRGCDGEDVNALNGMEMITHRVIDGAARRRQQRKVICNTSSVT